MMHQRDSALAENNPLRTFGPPEVGLSDAALLDRAERAYRLIRMCEWAIELREAEQQEGNHSLAAVVTEFAYRFLRPDLLADDRPYADRSNVGVAIAAQRLRALQEDRERATDRARARLAFAQQAWKAAAAEMVRRFLKPPATAVEVVGPEHTFRMWISDEGEPIVAVQLAVDV